MQVVHKGKKRIALRIVSIVMPALLAAAALIVPRYLPVEAANYYSAKIFPVVSIIPQSINMFFQYSLTENLVIVIAIVFVIGLVIWLVRLITKLMGRGAGKYLFVTLRNMIILAAVLSVLFQMLHGINFRRTPVRVILDLNSGTKYEYEDYQKALFWAYSGMINARKLIGEDYNGVGHMSQSFENSASYANSLVNAFCAKYDIPISRNYVRAKPVAMSHYWSWTYIVGMYTAFLAEVNINTDYEDITTFPVTVCHEILHAKGIASETDCELIASLACCSATRADFRYAGFYKIYNNLLGIVTKYAKETGHRLVNLEKMPDMYRVNNDRYANYLYWQNIDNEVKTFERDFLGLNVTDLSTQANDTFLKSNGEKEGEKTYIVPYNSYVDFYKKYVEEEENAKGRT